MKIKELTQAAGLSAPTIRYYEAQGLLDSRHVSRGHNNYRDYTEEAVAHLHQLKVLQAAGYTLAELRALTLAGGLDHYSPADKIELLRQKIGEIEKKQAELDKVRCLLYKMLGNKIKTLESEEC